MVFPLSPWEELGYPRSQAERITQLVSYSFSIPCHSKVAKRVRLFKEV